MTASLHYFKRVLSYSLCPGNTDSDFVELIDKEGGELKAKGRIITSLDTSWEFTIDGCTYDKTIRASDRTTRCAACTRYRGQLHVRRYREKCHDEPTSAAHDSHTPYVHLPRASGKIEELPKGKEIAQV